MKHKYTATVLVLTSLLLSACDLSGDTEEVIVEVPVEVEVQPPAPNFETRNGLRTFGQLSGRFAAPMLQHIVEIESSSDSMTNTLFIDGDSVDLIEGSALSTIVGEYEAGNIIVLLDAEESQVQQMQALLGRSQRFAMHPNFFMVDAYIWHSSQDYDLAWMIYPGSSGTAHVPSQQSRISYLVSYLQNPEVTALQETEEQVARFRQTLQEQKIREAELKENASDNVDISSITSPQVNRVQFSQDYSYPGLFNNPDNPDNNYVVDVSVYTILEQFTDEEKEQGNKEDTYYFFSSYSAPLAFGNLYIDDGPLKKEAYAKEANISLSVPDNFTLLSNPKAIPQTNNNQTTVTDTQSMSLTFSGKLSVGGKDPASAELDPSASYTWGTSKTSIVNDVDVFNRSGDTVDSPEWRYQFNNNITESGFIDCELSDPVASATNTYQPDSGWVWSVPVSQVNDDMTFSTTVSLSVTLASTAASPATGITGCGDAIEVNVSTDNFSQEKTFKIFASTN